MTEYMEIGPAPCNEECAQVGDEDYMAKSRKECQRFIELIRKKLGPEPEGAKLVVQSHKHDYGVYVDVACKYDENIQAAVEYAFKCESEAPTTWE